MRVLRAPAISLLVVVALVRCGGKVVVDEVGTSTNGAGGGGAVSTGAGGSVVVSTSSASSSGACVTTPAPGNVVVSICAPSQDGVCLQDQVADDTNSLHMACPGDKTCFCAFSFVTSPCPPKSGCCYDVEAKAIFTSCE